MFELPLTEATATLENLNARMEKAGADKIPAADLKLSVAQSADVLAHFSPELKGFLFDESGPRDLAEGMRLRQAHLDYPIGLDHEMTGATVKIEYGVGKPLEFTECKVNQFRITPMDGGSVVVGFRVQCRPDEKQIGKLYLLQEQGVTLTLTPMELPAIGEKAA